MREIRTFSLILVPWDWNFVTGVYAARTAAGMRGSSADRCTSVFVLLIPKPLNMAANRTPNTQIKIMARARCG